MPITVPSSKPVSATPEPVNVPETSVPTPQPPTGNASVAALKEHLTAQENAALKFHGSSKCNPSLWIARNVKPLRDALKGGVTPELAEKIKAIKWVAPEGAKPTVP